MKILVAHNNYLLPGGEDAVVRSEVAMLKQFGEEVLLYDRNNKEIESASISRKIQYIWELGGSPRTYREIRSLIKGFRPDVAHFHNIFFSITPSAYQACKDEGVPVVQSQHNFRLLCSNALFYRDNKVCEDCLGKNLIPGIYHRCYKNSFWASYFLSRMLQRHWQRGTWLNMVDSYVVAAEFTRQKYIQGGIPADKIFVKPNFFDQALPESQEKQNDYVLYVGRLSEEKGVDVLINAWRFLEGIPLKIMGQGVQEEQLKGLARGIKDIDFVGYVSQDEYHHYMSGARVIVLPSLCYESFPRVFVEACAYWIPAVASRLGSLQELVKDGENGLTFDPGNPHDLAQKMRHILNDENEWKRMREKALESYRIKYTPQKNYEMLKDIYNQVILKSKTIAKNEHQ